MPYIQKWVEPDKDETLAVEKDLPNGYQERVSALRPYRLAEREQWEGMYYCDACEGWLMDWPNEYLVNTLDPHHRSGVRGKDYHCRRCGKHLGFSGANA